MTATETLCSCGQPATTEIQTGWSRERNSGVYAPVCEACWADSDEGRHHRREAAVRSACVRLGLPRFPLRGNVYRTDPVVEAEAARIDPEAFAPETAP